ncbi:radical SAM/SPASM domain-containing protein [Desulfosarcina ovata]|uniref:Radical SAM core domain-containing protein n=1 Tax=Desulfosarcina ovata subsp. ovata TaxID=2752305 RepID=A0A5K8A915_9BACT|nr:radical SAM protein [Desulfosarcina ovata]BBO88540.1 hypothetical protein DSCOOX_17200 [Desulfosarcina ovata subsp. ovata]
MVINKGINAIKTISSDFVQLYKREIDFYKAVPRHALLFLTFRCTSKCRACTMWKRIVNEKDELNLQQWKNIIKDLSVNGVKIIELFGGDVFLRKELTVELIKYSNELGMVVHMPTNAILLDEETIQEIVDAGLHTLYISVDEIDKNHDKIRGTKGNFDHIIKSIVNLKKVRSLKGSKRPTVYCNTTISKLNIDSIEEIVSFAHKQNFDVCALEYIGEFTEVHVKRSRIDGIYPDPYFLLRGESLLLNNDQAKKLKKTVPKLIKKYKYSDTEMYTLNIDTLSKKNIVSGTVPNTKCYMERNQVTVDPYGNIIACPFFSNYKLGNLSATPLQDIWNNKTHLRFREQQNKNTLKMCSHCIMGVERNYNIIKGMQRIYYKRIHEKLI